MLSFPDESEKLNDLFDFTINFNNKKSITGVLIYKNSHFFQIIEGKSKHINKLFGKIIEDNRHSGLIKLLDQEISEKVFTNYDSGHFAVLNQYANLKRLYSYYEDIKYSNNTAVHKLVSLTKNFLKYNP